MPTAPAAFRCARLTQGAHGSVVAENRTRPPAMVSGARSRNKRGSLSDRSRDAAVERRFGLPLPAGRPSHLVRHTTAVHLLQAGVDITVIALWLGHESIETTHIYLEADLALKERALEKVAPVPGSAKRFKADNSLLAFLAKL